MEAKKADSMGNKNFLSMNDTYNDTTWMYIITLFPVILQFVERY